MEHFFASLGFFLVCAGSVALLGVWVLYCGLLADRARGRPRCPKCWYDLGGSTALGVAADAARMAAGDAAVVSSPTASPASPESATSGGSGGASAAVATCPECGKKIKHPRQLYRIRRHWWTIALGTLLVSLALYSYEVRHRLLRYKESFKTATVPSTYYIVALPYLGKADFDRLENRFYSRQNGKPQGPGLWGWQDALYRRSLSQLVNGEDLQLSTSALHVLLSMASKGNDDALERFISHLDHPNATIRRQALSWAQALGERMLPGRDAVIARLKDEDEQVREQAYFTLATIGPRQTGGMSTEAVIAAAEVLSDRSGNGWVGNPFEFYLCEIIRRGDEASIAWLKKKVANPPKSRWGDAPNNLELVTALRRIEKRADPLSVEIEPAELRVKDGVLPKIKVTLRNTDPDKIDLGFQMGGDNRGPRPERFRFEVRDANGAPMPLILESMNFGGLSSFTTLKPGATYEWDVPMDKYVEPLKPGTYSVVVLYHDSQQIAGIKDVTGAIVARSKPVRLVVEP